MMHKNSEERGVILILTLFVLLISYAMVAQLTLGTAVAWQITKNASDRIRLEYACKSAAEEIVQMLKDDSGMVEDAEELLEGEFASAAADQGLSGAGEEEELEESALDTSACDSSRDSWFRPARYNYGDIEVTSWVEDENGKFNLHLLLVEDEAMRIAAEEAFLRILDALREDFEDDLDSHESNRILDQLRELMDGDKRAEDFIPRAFRHSDSEESERVLLYSLEELLLLQDVDEFLFYDQVMPEHRIAAGLESVFTVFTSVGLDPETEELEGGDTVAEASGGDLNPDGTPASGPDAGSGFGEDTATEEEGPFGSEEEIVEQELLAEAAAAGGLKDVLEGDPPLGTLININTAHRAVIEGIVARDTLPLYMVDQILRFRNEVDEEAQRQADGEELESNEVDLRRALYREDESVPLQVFASLEDLSEVEEWEERMDEEARATFEDMVSVSSDIFSLYLFARIAPDDWNQEDWYEEPPGSVLRLRTIVWRRNGESGAKLITLLPWHEVPYRRWRIPDFQDELPAYVRPEW